MRRLPQCDTRHRLGTRTYTDRGSGPLSDRFGRKRPLVGGLAIYIVASIACALATSMSDVVLWRFVQAFGGSIVPTVVQAMVRDLYDRNQSARILSLNMLVTASAPVVAFQLGSIGARFSGCWLVSDRFLC